MGRRRKSRAPTREIKDPTNKPEPHTMVVQRGKYKLATKQLKLDLRRVLQPNTAMKLKEREYNVLRDFVDVCGPLGVSHLLVFSATEQATYLKIIKAPEGPTVTFRVDGYALIKDVRNSVKTPRGLDRAFEQPPLVVMTNFTAENHHKLATNMLQNMFPAINPKLLDVKARKRLLLLDYDKERDVIRLRHYHVGLPVSGVNQGIKQLMRHHLPGDLGDMKDVSDFISKTGYGTESEGEDPEESRVYLGYGYSTSAEKRKRRVRLQEIGPRMDLELVKIEQGVCDGLVLHHKYVHKTLEEIAETQQRREEHARLKAARRKTQEENVKRKKEAKEKRKARSEDPVAQANAGMEEVNDDDAEYYREEVGEEPDEHFGTRIPRREERAKFRPQSKAREGGQAQRRERRGNGGKSKAKFSFNSRNNQGQFSKKRREDGRDGQRTGKKRKMA